MLRVALFFCVLLGFTYSNGWLVKYFALPLPSSLLGLLILFCIFLVAKKVPKDLVKASGFLLRYMALFFVPVTLSVVMFKQQILQYGVLVIFTLLVSTIISLLVTLLVAKKLSIEHHHDD
ncbi:CidA/LrgA family protein [Aliiglaciecola sp. LCG003]|uniref:CidA/LrgA family protein n=1 Tax=Aliiglaciecola sp. LCG003 TaxID=3053655 RepID=UPI002572D4F0|nr:CidA/LrgA family protein [Aliiglaciecola sp. LCG003]WJG10371.1 CidA/LrgA family protein [Aliiglaciecola sp. LCG003]